MRHSFYKVCVVEFMKVISMQRENIHKTLQDFQRDTRWLDGNYDELKERFPEEYVAVYREKVVDHDPNLEELLTRLEEKYPGKRGKIAIEYVTQKEVELVLCA